MIDPKRWLDEGGGATFQERELLSAGREARAPSKLRNRVWLGIMAGAAGFGSAAEAAGSALLKGVTVKGALSVFSGSAVKGALALTLLGGAGFGIASLGSSGEVLSRASAPRVTPSVLAAAPEAVPPFVGENRDRSANAAGDVGGSARLQPAAPTSVETQKRRALGGTRRSLRPTPPVDGPNADGTARPAEPTPESRATSRLREESAAVVAIRNRLLSGEPIEALRMLDRARVDFPEGALAQEREALTVRALALSGQSDAARRRGEAFLRAFPRSPYAAELRALLSP
jgi:hypothetical protein